MGKVVNLQTPSPIIIILVSSSVLLIRRYQFADESVENREWLWQRPYTTLEIQHRPGAQPCTPMDQQGEAVSHIVMEVGGKLHNNLTEELRDDGRYQDHDGVNLEIKKVTDDCY